MSDGQHLSNTSVLIRYSLLVLFLFEILAGPIRYIFGSSGTYELVYAPKIELAFVILVLVGTGRAVGREFYLFAAAALIFGLLGVQQLPSAEQPLFALWTMVPFAFSLIAARHVFLDFPSYKWIFLSLYLIVIAGVYVNYFYDFPWSGLTYQIAGQDVQTSRSWHEAGFSRISGLSRTSFNAAAQTLVLVILVVQQTKSKILSFSLWILAGIAIVLTTTKGVILSFGLITIYFLARQIGNMAGRLMRYAINVITKLIIILSLLVMVYAPLSTLASQYHLAAHSYISSLLFLSFQERLAYTWPHALALIKNQFEFLLGTGIGGIGAGQTYFDPLHYNPADNLFVFLLVQYGFLFSIALLVFLSLKVLRINSPRSAETKDFAFVSLCIFLFVYGCTTNELEDVFLSTSLGFCLSYRKTWHETL